MARVVAAVLEGLARDHGAIVAGIRANLMQAGLHRATHDLDSDALALSIRTESGMPAPGRRRQPGGSAAERKTRIVMVAGVPGDRYLALSPHRSPPWRT